MSGDVQPRKRKDKKRKRDSLDRKSEGEIFARKFSLQDDEDPKEHHGVHVTKMGTDDIHLHVQSEHITGGHWCAKILFFSLLAILLGLIGLIIIENRGLSDLDTPLSESRFSEYFEGWVDEHRDTHDEHDVDHLTAELEDHDAEPFEEEEDRSELEGDEEHDDHEDHEDATDHEEENVEEAAEEEHGGEEDNADDEENGADEEDEETPGVDDEEDDDQVNQDEEEQSEQEQSPSYTRSKREVEETKDEDEDEVDEGFGDVEEASEENLDAEKAEQNVDEIYASKFAHESLEQVPPSSSLLNDRDTFEEDDDDFESLENVVDNDADELLHLQQQKAEKEAQEHLEAEEPIEEEPESSSQIKSRPGGPQLYTEDEFIEEELRKVNEEMLQNQFNFQ